ncbi:co-chaperone GroES [Caldinitratiruptor microaerophilus]|uniref:Co-chaperonin GroES n=1 Tax=Caldinitratiruptor microaerophilus TaxID=671077 RepID=A0AA35CLI9_9FIRM|nr:co-chaperone GroES [Caldinitratiruptor microaerophilus]BDG61357.1 10 kDa chaperonin [Caldinitratiruptor microaerophilus]
MQILPLDDRLLVEPIQDEGMQRTAGGIYLPDTAKEKPRIARVVAVGTDEDLKEKVKEGDRILFGKYSGDEIEMDGHKYLILQRNEVLALIKD